jgi:hypothetical protein
MILLQQEIKHNNKVKLAQTPRYISRPEKREGKAVSSVMIALKTAEDAHTLKRTKVIVLYECKRVSDFHTSRTTDQYHRCLAFSHHYTICNSPQGPLCAICVEPHPTDLHVCTDCPNHRGRQCIHTTLRCANCSAAGHADHTHAAYNPQCPVKAAVIQDAWQRTKTAPPTEAYHDIPQETNPIADTNMTADT